MQLDEPFYGDLAQFIVAASERPELRAMLPFLSLNRFAVSPAHYPQPGGPIVKAIAPGRFAVMDYRGGTVFGEGTAQQAIEILLAEMTRMERDPLGYRKQRWRGIS